ncbi:hypothetical protein AgCh_017476 [Apium graveolens]
MNEFDKTPTELLHMLRTYETNMKAAEPAPIMMVENKGKAKGKGKWKDKKKIGSDSTPKLKSGHKQALKPKGGVAKGECHYCKNAGHWKKNCTIYLENLKKMKAVQISESDIYVIEVNLSISSHIYINVQGLQRSRTLAKGEVDLRVGNGAKVAALAVGTYYLSFPSRLILELEDYFYVPAIRRNIISVSCLDKKGHINEKRISKLHKDEYLDKFDFESYQECESCLVGKMTKAPFTGKGQRATKRLELIYSDADALGEGAAIRQKNKEVVEGRNRRALGDIGNLFTGHGIEGKQHEIPQVSRPVTRGFCAQLVANAQAGVVENNKKQRVIGHQKKVTVKPRPKDIIIISPDTKEASGNLFGKLQKDIIGVVGDASIKILRSNRGGEYLSTEFREYLKECGIVSQLTPPGIPQWKGVSERRNRTLLDMVRSMMSHAGLLISLWGYVRSRNSGFHT